MTKRSDLRTEISYRLGDISNAVFTAIELNQYIDKAVKSLYPTYFKFQVATSDGEDGPLQTMPTTASNLYYIGVQKPNSTRVRLLRQWKEGEGEAFIPKTGLSGQTLVWAWTEGFFSPDDDIQDYDMNGECEEVVILRCCISALERISSSRVEIAKYFALTVREGVTEADIVAILDAYHASLEARIKAAIPRPERVG